MLNFDLMELEDASPKLTFHRGLDIFTVLSSYSALLLILIMQMIFGTQIAREIQMVLH